MTAPGPSGRDEGAQVAEPTGTGDDVVDAALTRLVELDELPVHDHAVVLEAVHVALGERLQDPEA